MSETKTTEILIPPYPRDEGPVAYSWIDSDGLIRRPNRRMADLTGLTVEDLEGLSVLDIWAGTTNGQAKMGTLLQRVRESGIVRDEEVELHRTGEPSGWVSATLQGGT